MFGIRQDRINTVKVHRAGELKTARRIAVKNALSQLQLNPGGMSPSSVLLVQKISDPRLMVHDSKGIDTQTWRAATQEQLREAHRNAERPRSCEVSGSPTAILFRDRAELIATLCADIVSFRAAGKWWWRSFAFRSSYVSSQLVQLLHSDLTLLPAVFFILNDQSSSRYSVSGNKALKLVRALDSGDAQLLAQAILYEFGFRQLANDLTYVQEAQGHTEVFTHARKKSFENEGMDDGDLHYYSPTEENKEKPERDINFSRIPPWMPILGRNSWHAELSREQNMLLGLARMLHESSFTLRSKPFQYEVIRWWHSSKSEPVKECNENRENHSAGNQASQTYTDNILESENFGQHHDAFTNAEQAKQELLHRNTQPELEQSNAGTAQTMPYNKKAPESTYQLDQKKIGSPDKVGKIEFHVDNDDTEEAQSYEMDKPVVAERNRTVSDYLHRSDSDRAITFSESGNDDTASFSFENDEEFFDKDIDLQYSEVHIDTELAGVFYIINLLSQLGIPDYFNEHWHIDEQISYWGITEVIARALLGKEFLVLHKDPVWKLLAKLDRRRKFFPIASRYRGAKDYIIPENWFHYLIDAEQDTFFWAVHQNRLRVWTKRIPLIDTQIEPQSDPLTLAKKIAANLFFNKENDQNLNFTRAHFMQAAFKKAPLDNRTQLKNIGFNDDLAYWLALVLPAIRSYLKYTLTINTATPRSLLPNLFELDARIYISACHIDLVADVNQASLLLRRCGLDQDPGWQVNFGRVILFHFQS